MATATMELETRIANARKALTEHKDECYWCKFHPFSLCGTGADLLRAIPFYAPSKPPGREECASYE
jgi:hypothetical protein